MGSRKYDLPGGLLVPLGITADLITDQGAGDTDSSFTEAGPRPGHPIMGDQWSQLRLSVSGEQGADMDVRLTRSGQPARDGLQIAIKKDSEAATAWRGWDSPSSVVEWFPIDWTVASQEIRDVCVIPSSQKVVLAYAASGCKFAVIDVDNTVTIASGTLAAGADWNYPAIVCLPESERLVCLFGGASYYSDDEGESWTQIAPTVTSETTTDYEHTSACVYRGDIVIFVQDGATAETIHHLVSTDGGASFNLVSSVASLGIYPNCASNEDGVHVTWVDQGTAIEYRRLGTSFEALDIVTQTDVGGTVAAEFAAIWTDGTGTIYIAGTSGGTSNGTSVIVYTSTDSGETWTTYTYASAIVADTNDQWIGTHRAAYSNGRVLLFSGYLENLILANKLGALVMGGWSTVTAISDVALSDQPWNRPGAEVTYAPYAVPDNTGWTATGSGSGAINSEGSLAVTSGASTARGYSVALGGEAYAIATFVVKQVSGGSSGSSNIALRLRLADASSYEYEAEIQIYSTGYDLADVNGAGNANRTVDMTTFRVLRLRMDKGTLEVWDRAPGSTTWTVGGSITVTDAGATANAPQILFGNLSNGAAESRWRLVACQTNTQVALQMEDVIGSIYGKPLNARPEPIPDMGTSDGVAHIAATAGPGRLDETADIDVYYEHGIEQCHAELHPGRSSTWRSTDTSEQYAVYDRGAARWLGHATALVVLGANFREIYLEAWNGSSWVEITKVDLAEGFNGLSYTLTGDTVTPDLSSGTAADRWLWEEEKRNGVAIFTGSTGPTTAATRMLEQSSGGWQTTATGTTVIPVITLEDTSQISGLAGTKTVRLCSPDGLVIQHHTTLQTARYVRWRIPAGTAGDDTPEGESYYEASIISILRVQAFGAEVNFGGVDEAEPNQITYEDEVGTRRIRSLGVERRTWSLGGWATGPANLTQLRLGADGNYVSSSESSALGLAGAEDVYHLARGLYRVTDGGSLPVVAVEPLPNTSDLTLTDPSRFIYGHITSTLRATTATGVLGDTTGEGEVLRVDDLVIREIV